MMPDTKIQMPTKSITVSVAEKGFAMIMRPRMMLRMLKLSTSPQ